DGRIRRDPRQNRGRSAALHHRAWGAHRADCGSRGLARPAAKKWCVRYGAPCLKGTTAVKLGHFSRHAGNFAVFRGRSPIDAESRPNPVVAKKKRSRMKIKSMIGLGWLRSDS